MQTLDYIGIPWVSGGKTIEGFDCWGMVQHWYATRLHKKLPDNIADPDSILSVAKSAEAEQNSSRWVELSEPQKNCIVAMGRNSKVTHVGVYIGDDLVLHCARDAGKCVVQPLFSLYKHWKILKFYVPND